MTLWSISLDAIYNSPIGTDAVFSAFAKPARVVDKTAGVEVQPLSGGTRVPTIVPAAMVRRSELVANGITDLVALIDSTVTLNGVTWIIVNTGPVAQPDGEAGGEVRLHLRKQP